MQSEAIRAVYEAGQLRLLDPVDLVEGQEIQLLILSEPARVQVALRDLLVARLQRADEEVDEAALLRDIEEAFQGQALLSETILHERHQGP